MYRLFRLLWILSRREALARGKKKVRTASPGLLWLLPPFRGLFWLRHPMKAASLYLCLHALRCAALLLRRFLR